MVLSGCAHDVVARFPLARPGDTGAIAVVLNDPSDRLSVTVDDQLVVDREHSRRATITGVPAGTAHVVIAAGGRCETGAVSERDVTVSPGVTTTLALPGPNPDHGCMIYTGLAVVALAIDAVAMAVLVPGPHPVTSHVK